MKRILLVAVALLFAFPTVTHSQQHHAASRESVTTPRPDDVAPSSIIDVVTQEQLSLRGGENVGDAVLAWFAHRLDREPEVRIQGRPNPVSLNTLRRMQIWEIERVYLLNETSNQRGRQQLYVVKRTKH